MAEKEELGLEVFVEGWQQFERIMDRLDKSAGDLEKGMGGVTKAGDAFSVAVGNIAANAVSRLADLVVDTGQKVADFTADSIGMAADFQSSMAVLSVAASSTGLTFDELKAAALAVGGDTRLLGVNATGAAESLTGLFKAGLTSAEIFGDLNAYMEDGAQLGGALRASIDLAAATELDMVQASDLAAVALASFGSELETETERAAFVNDAMNNMVQAADASVAEVSGLAEALKMVGPTAGGAGISIEDINNALALLSTRGIEGSMAGTSLNRMLLDLTKTTPKAQEAMDDLGISVYDAEGNLLPLVDIIGKFEKALGGATDAEKAAALQAIFTAQGQRAINTLMAEGVNGWTDMAAATDAAAGIQEQAAIRGQTFNAQMEALEGIIETVRIGIGDALLPVATELLEWFAGMVSEYGPALADWLGTKIPEAIDTLTSFFTETLLPIAEEVVAFIEENMVPILAGLSAMILTVVVPAFTAWATSTIAALGPVLLPIAAIGAAVALLAKAWDEDFLGMRTVITEFWESSVKPAFEAVALWLQTNIPIAIETAREWWEEILKPALEKVWLFIQENIVPIFETIVTWLSENIPLAIENARIAWEEILKPALEMVWSFITESLFPLIVALVDFFDAAFTLAVRVMAGLWQNVLQPALEGVWEFIKIYALPIFEALEEFWIEHLDPAIEDLADLFAVTLKTAWEDFMEVADWARIHVLDPVKKAFDAIAGAIKDVIRFINDCAEALRSVDLGPFTPGSPTPFEIGLRGIADAMREVEALSSRAFAGVPSMAMASIAPTATPSHVVNNYITHGNQNQNEFNFTAQSLMQPGQMEMEFSTMAMRSR
jgi:TP901 family phage tail tape measure protein